MKPIRYALLAAAVLLLAACGSSTDDATTSTAEPEAEDGATTITFMHRWPEDQYLPYFQAMADAFEAETGITVVMDPVAFQPYKDKIQVLASQDIMPDIYFAWAGDYAKQFVDAGHAADLSAELADTEWGDSFDPLAIDGYTYEGAHYGVPLTINLGQMVYNPQVFDQYGLGVPGTLDELFSVCEALEAEGVQPIAFGNKDGWPATHYATNLFPMYVDQETILADYSGSDPQWNDPGYLAALEKFNRILDECIGPNVNGVAHDEARAQFLTGNAAMLWASLTQFSVLDEGAAENGTAWAPMEFPQAADGLPEAQGRVTGAPDGLLVNANSANREEAIEFLRFLTRPENATQLAEETGWISAVAEANTEETLSDAKRQVMEAYSGAPGMNIWLDTVTPPETASVVLSGLEGFLNGDLSAEEFIATIRDSY